MQILGCLWHPFVSLDYPHFDTVWPFPPLKNIPRTLDIIFASKEAMFKGLSSHFQLMFSEVHFLLTRADFASFLNTNFMILSFSSDWTQEIPRSHSLKQFIKQFKTFNHKTHCMGQIIRKARYVRPEKRGFNLSFMKWN